MPSNSRLRPPPRPTPKWAQEAGLSKWESSCWGGPSKADELAERHRPRASLYPESIRRLAVAMVEHALADLERPRWIRGTGRYVPADYRPDPEGAIAWLHRAGDAPLSARWCEQITSSTAGSGAGYSSPAAHAAGRWCPRRSFSEVRSPPRASRNAASRDTGTPHARAITPGISERHQRRASSRTPRRRAP